MSKDYKPRVTVGSIPIDDEPIYKGLFWDAETKKFYRWEDLPKEIKDVD